jgi:4-hydroxy-tetrahydrodipicolinate synthase
MDKLNSGVWPTMITPYTEDKQIDWRTLDQLIEWYIASGVSGLFAVCLSSEILHLTEDERIKLATHTVNRVNGRIQVVSGCLLADNNTDRIKQVYETRVDAVIFLANQIFQKNQDKSKSQRIFDDIISAVDDIPLGIYESPLPYHKILSSDELKIINSSNRLYFMKDTSCDIDKIEKKLEITTNTNCRFFNANTPTLLESLKLGADGYSGIGANFYPELYVWMYNNYLTEPILAEELSDFLRIADFLIGNKYPVSAKIFQKINGIDFSSICRSADHILTNAEISSLESLHRVVKNWHSKLKI